MDGKLKASIPPRAAFVVALGVSFGIGWRLGSSKKPVTVERIVTQDIVKYVDREVAKNVVTTVTKPNGTKIVISDNSRSVEHVDESAKTRQIEQHIAIRPTYSLGVAVEAPEDKFSAYREYRVEFGRRVSNSPFWVNFAFTADGEFKNRQYALGLRMEF